MVNLKNRIKKDDGKLYEDVSKVVSYNIYLKCDLINTFHHFCMHESV